MRSRRITGMRNFRQALAIAASRQVAHDPAATDFVANEGLQL
jgi:hypothetical protein